MFNVMKKFCEGWKDGAHKKHIREEKKMRDNLSEKQIDQRDRDSGPASDPASTY